MTILLIALAWVLVFLMLGNVIRIHRSQREKASQAVTLVVTVLLFALGLAWPAAVLQHLWIWAGILYAGMVAVVAVYWGRL
jgi:hypothetical protein